MNDAASPSGPESRPTAGTLEQLAAAVISKIPSAILLEQSDRSMALRSGGIGQPQVFALLIETRDAGSAADELAEIQAHVEKAMASLRSRRYIQLHVLVVDSRNLAVERQLDAIIPRTLVLRAERHVHVLSSDGKLKTVRGADTGILPQAVALVRQGRMPDFEATVWLDRARHAAGPQGFLLQLEERPARVTSAIAVFSIALFGLQLYWGGGEPIGPAARMGAAAGELIAAGQIWRLLAATVLHGSLLHLLFNMTALFSFSRILERFLGWPRYLLLYVVSGLGGSLAGLFRDPHTMSVGASGGIWGLMVAGAVLVTWPRHSQLALLTPEQRRRAWIPVAINGLYSFIPGIDWRAHLGGGVIGGLLMISGSLTGGGERALAKENERSLPPGEPLALRWIAALAGAVTVLCVVISLATGRPWELNSAPRLSQARLEETNMSVALPRLITPPKYDHRPTSWTFGGLGYDPVAFIIEVAAEDLGDLPGARAEQELKSAIGALKPELLEGFTLTMPTELRRREGTPYLYSRQTSSDERVIDTYWIIRQSRLMRVHVAMSSLISEPWRRAAADVPFSLTTPASPPSPSVRGDGGEN